MTFKLNNILKPFLVLIVVVLVAVGCSSSSNAGNKPSKKELTNHFVELAQDEGGLADLVPEKTLQKVYSCLFDEAYDDLSAKTLNEMLKVTEFDEKSEYPFDLEPSEKKIFDRASKVCEEEFKNDPDLNFDSEEKSSS